MKKLLVEREDGSFVRKPRAKVEPTDRVVFDGPDAFKGPVKLQRDLEARIKAAGGLAAWRAKPSFTA